MYLFICSLRDECMTSTKQSQCGLHSFWYSNLSIIKGNTLPVAVYKGLDTLKNSNVHSAVFDHIEDGKH